MRKVTFAKAKHRPNYTIIDSSVFENFILDDELFVKSLQSLETCPPVNENLHRKLVSSLEFPVALNERFKVT